MTVTTEEFKNGISSTTYSFTFPYYKTSDVKVAVWNASTNVWDLKTENTTGQTDNDYWIDGGNVKFNSNPTSGTGNIHIYRETDVDTSKATFAAGSSIRATDLNNNETQILYAAQERQGQKILASDIKAGSITSTQLADNAVISSKILDGTIVNADVNASAAIAGTKISPNFGAQAISTSGNLSAGATTITGNIAVSGNVDGRDIAALGSKLDGIETAATADQTGAEIKVAYEAESNTNAYTDAEKNKLAAIDAAATDDQTAAEIRVLVGNASDSNVFTDADHVKLDSIESGATEDQTIAEIKSLIAGSPLDASHLAANSVTTSEIADAELTTLAGATSGTASIIGDGSKTLLADIDELNLLDGKSVVTSVSGSSNDNQFPTAKAVNDQILSVTNALGGFVAIANETVFPNANPDPSDGTGTVVSIGDAGGLAINGSGVATVSNGNVANNATITINGFPSTLNGTTLSAGQGLQVQTTSTLHTYDYHKLIPNEAGVGNIQTAIDDFNNRYQVASSAPSTQADGTALEEGDLWYDQGNDEMKVYDNTLTAFKAISSTGNYSILDLRNAANNGTATYPNDDFTLVTKGGTSAVNPNHAAQLIVSINGVIQEPNTGTSRPTNGFALDGSTIKFSNDIPANPSIFIAKIGATVDIGTPSNNTVTAAILQSSSVERAKIQADAIDGTKIADLAVDTEHIADDAVDLTKVSNSIAASLSANDAKVTNATHTGEVTGATALTIADDVVDEANLKISNAGSNGQFLSKQSGDTGGLTWAAVPAGVGGAAGVDFNDGVKARFGTGNDMEIYGQANNAGLITNAAGGIDVSVGASPYQVSLSGWNTSGTPASNLTIVANSGSNTYADLRYDGNVKLATNNTGITVTGTVAATAYTGDGSALTGLDSTKAGGAIYENSNTISTTHTLTANTNGMSAGPVTVSDGVTLTIPSGATYTVV